MYDLSNSGLSLRQVGKLFGISHTAVRDHLKAITKKAEKMVVNFGGADMKYNSLISHLQIGNMIDDFYGI